MRTGNSWGPLAMILLGMCYPQGVLAQEVHIYSATDTAAMASLIDGFESTYPGIVVDYREFNTTELYNAVEAGRANEADVIISSSTDLQVKLVNEGRASIIQSLETTNLPTWAKWRYELFAFTYEPVVAIYNRAAFKDEQLPKTRSELASSLRDAPEFYANKIGSYDISLSGVGYMFTTQDMQRGYQFWRLIESLGRAGLQTYCCTLNMLNDVASGKLVYAYNVIGTYARERAMKDERIGVYTFDDYTLVMSRTAFVPKSAPNREAGIAFVNYILSGVGQESMNSQTALIPLAAAEQGPPGGALSIFGNPESMLPIRIGPSLLAYLDQMKKRRILQDWTRAIIDPQLALPAK